MKFTFRHGTENLTVFAYHLDGVPVYAGYAQPSEIFYYGENFLPLDLEYQRRMADGQNPTIETIILATDKNAHEAQLLASQIKTVWKEPRRRKFILHVERNIVFRTLTDVAKALDVTTPATYAMLDRPMFTRPKPGSTPRNRLVRTDRMFDADLRRKYTRNLTEWRRENGYL